MSVSVPQRTGSNVPQRTEADQRIVMLNGMVNEIARALPKHMDAGRLARIVTTSIRQVPELAKCSPESFFGAVLQSAQMGLEPNNGLGHAYLVPYKGICQLQIGYRGLLDLAYRSGKVHQIYAEVVREHDLFEYELGLEPRCRHVPSGRMEPGDWTHVYAVAHLAGGSKQFLVMSRAAVYKIRDSSPSKNSPAWRNWEEEMAKAKCLKRLCKWLPLSVEIGRAVSLDDEADAGVTQEYDREIRDVLGASVTLEVEPPSIPARHPLDELIPACTE